MSMFDRQLPTDEVITLIESEPLRGQYDWYPEGKLAQWVRSLWTLFTSPSKLHERAIIRYRQRIIANYLNRATNHVHIGNGTTIRDKSKAINEHFAAARLIEMYARLVTLSKNGLNESTEADDIRDAMDVYWYAVGRSEETEKRVKEMCVWLQNSIDPETAKA